MKLLRSLSYLPFVCYCRCLYQTMILQFMTPIPLSTFIIQFHELSSNGLRSILTDNRLTYWKPAPRKRSVFNAESPLRPYHYKNGMILALQAKQQLHIPVSDSHWKLSNQVTPHHIPNHQTNQTAWCTTWSWAVTGYRPVCNQYRSRRWNAVPGKYSGMLFGFLLNSGQHPLLWRWTNTGRSISTTGYFTSISTGIPSYFIPSCFNKPVKNKRPVSP